MQTDTGGVLERSYFTDVPLCRVGTYGNDVITLFFWAGARLTSAG